MNEDLRVIKFNLISIEDFPARTQKYSSMTIDNIFIELQEELLFF
jgi:hypothetical protein